MREVPNSVLKPLIFMTGGAQEASDIMRDVMLLEISDDHFSWLLGERGPPDPSLFEAPGGVDNEIVVKIIRKLVAELHQAGCHHYWMVVDNGEIVGLCGFNRPPDSKGEAEVGIGIAASRRRSGYAAAAFRLMMERSLLSGLSALTARTEMENIASQLMLEKSGFRQIGVIPHDRYGEMILWKRELTV